MEASDILIMGAAYMQQQALLYDKKKADAPKKKKAIEPTESVYTHPSDKPPSPSIGPDPKSTISPRTIWE